MSGDLSCLYTALRTALISTANSTPSWGTKAYADFVPKNTDGSIAVTRPYVVYGYAGGGDGSNLKKADPEFLIDVICVSENTSSASGLTTALSAEEEIRSRLDDAGEHEARRVLGDASWVIRTVTREMRIHFVEQVSGATQLFHSGARYRIEMEKR